MGVKLCLNVHVCGRPFLWLYEPRSPRSCIFNIEYYKFKDGSEMKSVGDTFTLNDFIDPLTNEIKIECKDGYHIQTGSEINVSCSSSDGEYGIPEITGCVPNVCSIGDTVSKYSFIGLSGLYILEILHIRLLLPQ